MHPHRRYANKQLSKRTRKLLRFPEAPTLSYWKPATNGSLDLQVPALEKLAAISAALNAGNNRDFEVHPMPGMNHLLPPARTGWADEYLQTEQTVDPSVLDLIANWIRKRTAGRASRQEQSSLGRGFQR